ncbi:MAG: tungstate ABC transporter substrate-binding protein WtpA [Deltaproteobacteria bacterium]|jgi:molybdate/tungstate transport system substrate-binding protein|nr:tungstate ABC transporter substrate-binding protein WtpA [Deltaproteobacteria bacterium]
MKRNRFFVKLAALAGVILILQLFMLANTMAADQEKVVIYHAGSLSVPFAEIEKNFESTHPSIDIVCAAGGSTKMARLISDQDHVVDIMASADYAVIDKSLIPAKASWNIRFATNQLVLCYTDRSRYADEINAQNWYEILANKDVSWGHSDPNLDPCGYRSLMVLQLAEKFYQKPGLTDQLIANRPKENVKAKAVELVELLKSGKLDYGWEYLSVAAQHDLKYIKLDDQINLGNYKFDDFYKQATVKVTGKKEGSWMTRTGKSITYGVTLINRSPNPKGAVSFLQYLLDPAGGLEILNSMGQPPFLPARVPSQTDYDRLPPELRHLVEVRQ